MLHNAIKALEQRFSRKQAVTGAATGITRKFDDMTAGFQPGDHSHHCRCVRRWKAPRFVMNCAQNAAQSRVPTLVFSLEMSKKSRSSACSVQRSGRSIVQEARFGHARDARGTGLASPKPPGDCRSADVDRRRWLAEAMEIRTKCRRWRSTSSIFPKGSMGLGWWSSTTSSADARLAAGSRPEPRTGTARSHADSRRWPKS